MTAGEVPPIVHRTPVVLDTNGDHRLLDGRENPPPPYNRRVSSLLAPMSFLV